MNNSFYVLRITKTSNLKHWPIGNFIYWRQYASWEYEDCHGPGMFDTYQSTDRLRVAMHFDSIDDAQKVLEENSRKDIIEFEIVKVNIELTTSLKVI